MITIISAMQSEIDKLLTQKQKVIKGKMLNATIGNHVCQLLCVGVGKKNVHKSIKRNIKKIGQSKLIIVIGVCGALDATFKIGDTIVPEKVSDNDGNSMEVNAFSHFNELRAYVVKEMGTVPYFCDREKKKELCTKYPAWSGVDMEAYHIYEIIAELDIDCIICKSVSDTADSMLPKEKYLQHYALQRNIFKKMKAIWRHPFETILFLKLMRNVNRAINSNIGVVRKIIDSI